MGDASSHKRSCANEVGATPGISTGRLYIGRRGMRERYRKWLGFGTVTVCVTVLSEVVVVVVMVVALVIPQVAPSNVQKKQVAHCCFTRLCAQLHGSSWSANLLLAAQRMRAAQLPVLSGKWHSAAQPSWEDDPSSGSGLAVVRLRAFVRRGSWITGCEVVVCEVVRCEVNSGCRVEEGHPISLCRQHHELASGERWLS